MNNNTCEHHESEDYSGDLICSQCGKVIQSNSVYTLEPSISEIIQSNQPTSRLAHVPVQLTKSLSHEGRSELKLHQLTKSLITTFALKSTYEDDAFALMRSYWQTNDSAIMYGAHGNRLLVACLFLLARRDRLAVNLTSLAQAIQSTPNACGQYFASLIQLEPSLRVLADAQSFVEHEVTSICDWLKTHYGLVIIEAKQRDLVRNAEKLAKFLIDFESGSSKASQTIAVAATWIAMDAFLHSDPLLFAPILKDNIIEVALNAACNHSFISIRSITARKNEIIDFLTNLGTTNLPATFNPLPTTKPKRYSLILSCLDDLLLFVQ